MLHDHPDPDAIASASGLSFLFQNRYNISSDIFYTGLISRAENRAMVKELNLLIKHRTVFRLGKHDIIALIDTQPEAGNHSLPKQYKCDFIIDHHPQYASSKNILNLIDTKIGATASLIIELLAQADLLEKIHPYLATALTYAIRTETQELGRETSDRDINAYLTIYPKSNIRQLSKISYPSLPNIYYKMLYKALQQAQIHKNLICVHLNQVPFPEIVAEMADMFLRHQRVTWTLCTGRYKNRLVFSLRSSQPDAKAGKMVKRLVPVKKYAGGHGTFAGGFIKVTDDQFESVEQSVQIKFSELFDYNNIKWKLLLEKE